jgi:hypothetical protein
MFKKLDRSGDYLLYQRYFLVLPDGSFRGLSSRTTSNIKVKAKAILAQKAQRENAELRQRMNVAAATGLAVDQDLQDAKTVLFFAEGRTAYAEAETPSFRDMTHTCMCGETVRRRIHEAGEWLQKDLLSHYLQKMMTLTIAVDDWRACDGEPVLGIRVTGILAVGDGRTYISVPIGFEFIEKRPNAVKLLELVRKQLGVLGVTFERPPLVGQAPKTGGITRLIGDTAAVNPKIATNATGCVKREP